MKNRRWMYIMSFIITFLLEVIIALYIKNGFIRSYFGDILIIICLYFFAKSIFDNKIKNIAIYILILGIIVEIMQYFNISKYIARESKVLKIALGTTFDIKDIICYLIGYVIIVITENIVHKIKK